MILPRLLSKVLTQKCVRGGGGGTAAFLQKVNI